MLGSSHGMFSTRTFSRNVAEFVLVLTYMLPPPVLTP